MQQCENCRAGLGENKLSVPISKIKTKQTKKTNTFMVASEAPT